MRPMTDPFVIAGESIAPGEARTLHLKLSENYGSVAIYMPFTVVRGAQPGPAVFFTGAVHGDEINGIEIVRRLTYALEPDTLRGTVLCVPIVNVPGYNSRSRYLPDGRDLNRMFPGKSHGSQSSRVAHLLYDGIVSRCRFGVDFHAGSGGRLNMPHVRADLSLDDVRLLALAFGTRVVLDGKGQRGSLRREAGKRGIATIAFEAGESGRFEQESVRQGVEGGLRLLRGLQMLPGPPLEQPLQAVVRKGEWLRSERGGIVELVVHPGELVSRGDLVGTVSNPYGRELADLRAPFDGLVVGVTVNPLVNPGSPVCHLLDLADTPAAVREALRTAP